MLTNMFISMAITFTVIHTGMTPTNTGIPKKTCRQLAWIGNSVVRIFIVCSGR